VDLRSNIAAEARAKIVYERLINFCRDPHTKDALHDVNALHAGHGAPMKRPQQFSIPGGRVLAELPDPLLGLGDEPLFAPFVMPEPAPLPPPVPPLLPTLPLMPPLEPVGLPPPEPVVAPGG